MKSVDPLPIRWIIGNTALRPGTFCEWQSTSGKNELPLYDITAKKDDFVTQIKQNIIFLFKITLFYRKIAVGPERMAEKSFVKRHFSGRCVNFL